MRHVAALAMLAIWLGFAAPAPARTDPPVWKCRASAGYTILNGGERAETIVANGNVNTASGQDPDHALCASGESGGGNLPAPLGVPSALLSAPSASAITTIDPELGESSEQLVTASGRVDDLALRIPVGGAAVIGATTADASAAARCLGGQPRLTGSSRVSGLTLGGAPIDADGLAAALASALSSASGVKVTTNETIRTATSLTIRALHVVVRNGASTVLDVVIAEAKVGFDGAVCDPSPPPVGRSLGVCPEGSTYFPDRNLCIIEGGVLGSAQGDIIVGTPQNSGSGGRVVPLDIARRMSNSRCLLDNGEPKFAQFGTKHSDKLYGRPQRDRILGLGGNDTIDGGSGDDCIDGGRGADSLHGSYGNDHEFGSTGRDTLNGGEGNDNLVGDSGNDTLNAAFGQDRVLGGAGNDAINIATAGKPASADCGPGTDTIRLNHNERKKISNCEDVHVFSGGG
jgi:Ca2+-binding RTX toxin-like protein